MHLLIATSNTGKIIEIKESLKGLKVTVKSPIDFGITESPHEHGETFEANALEKARFYYEKAKIPTLADDSGIIVEALEKELGVHTRRWGAGSTATDKEWIDFFLERMRHEKNKSAHFICCLALIDENGGETIFHGSCDGIITNDLEAGYLPGLPISACFRPDGYDSVYSAMSIDEKNAVSHRGRAVGALRAHLEAILASS